MMYKQRTRSRHVIILVGLLVASVFLSLAGCGESGTPVMISQPPPTVPPNGWVWQNPLPSGNTLLSVRSINGSTLVGVGVAGTVVRSTDGGTSWSLRDAGANQNLNAVAFMSGGRGCAVGDNGTILVTTDGGRTWAPRTAGTSSTLHGVHFLDAMTGMAVGAEGTLLRSIDGGNTWADQSFSGYQETLYAVAVLSAGHAIAAGADAILNSDNAGEDWTVLPAPAFEFRAISFAEDIGLIVGKDGAILRTDDAGASWDPVNPGMAMDLYDVTLSDANTGIAVGASGLILRSADGGVNWGLQASGTSSFDLRGAVLPTPDRGFIVGQNGLILRTTDGGTWTPRQQGPLTKWQDAVVTGERSAVLVGAGETLLTTDGGGSWRAANVPTTEPLNGVQFISATEGWAVGDNGTILHTTDGGENWTRLPVSISRDLLDVFFANAALGAVVWRQGIYYTDDGGANWRGFGSTLSRPEVVWSPAPYVVVAVGDNIDGGAGRLFVELDPDGGAGGGDGGIGFSAGVLHGLWFHDENRGIAVGDGGTIVTTVDAGQRWRDGGSPTTADLYAIAFLDAFIGWVVGEGGVIFATANGGLSWTRQEAPVGIDLNAVSFFDAQTGVVAGTGGAILWTTTGGLR